MSGVDRGRSHVPMSYKRVAGTNARPSPARAKSIDPVRSHRNLQHEDYIEKSSLKDYGYLFQKGQLVSIIDGKPFQFNVCRDNEDNQRRYHAIGRLVDQYIYELLENECGLQRIPIPVDARSGEPTGFFFASDNCWTAEILMIIIHGTGMVRAGQWSRKLIINENLQVGSQIEYIEMAKQSGFGVIVTNTNLNVEECSRSLLHKPRPIRGSACAEDHGCYIWEKFIRSSRARQICIVAHSYGGAVVLEMASRYTSEFDKRVFAIALTDSPMKTYTKYAPPNVLSMLKKRTVNWIASREKTDTDLGIRDYGRLRSAGHMQHEWTSHTSFAAIFRFIGEQNQLVKRHN